MAQSLVHNIIQCVSVLDCQFRPAQWLRLFSHTRIPLQGDSLEATLSLAAKSPFLWKRLAEAVDDALVTEAGPNLKWRRASGLPLTRSTPGLHAMTHLSLPALGSPVWTNAQSTLGEELLHTTRARLHVMAPPGMGKSTLVAHALFSRAAQRAEPVLWIDAARCSLRDGLADHAATLFGPIQVRSDERAYRVRRWLEERQGWLVVDHADRALSEPENRRWLPQRSPCVVISRDPIAALSMEPRPMQALPAENPYCQRLLDALGPQHPLAGALDQFHPRRQSQATSRRAHGRALEACLRAVMDTLSADARLLMLMWSVLGPEAPPELLLDTLRSDLVTQEVARAGLIHLDTAPRHLPLVAQEFFMMRASPQQLTEHTSQWLLAADDVWAAPQLAALARMALTLGPLEESAERALGRLVLSRALDTAAADDPAGVMTWLEPLAVRWDDRDADPMKALLHYQLGSAHLALLAPERAAAAFQRALEMLTSSPASASQEALELRVLQRLSHVLRSVGRDEEADTHQARLGALSARYGAQDDQ